METKLQNGSGKFGKNLYFVSAHNIESFGGYDTYDSFVACADSKDEARKMHPDGTLDENDVSVNWGEYRSRKSGHGCWINFEDIDKLDIEYLGRAHKTVKGTVLASFNAG